METVSPPLNMSHIWSPTRNHLSRVPEYLFPGISFLSQS